MLVFAFTSSHLFSIYFFFLFLARKENQPTQRVCVTVLKEQERETPSDIHKITTETDQPKYFGPSLHSPVFLISDSAFSYQFSL
ncbi:hypothetical protein RJT34_01856 [Clitoria ternatea]|uniref:Uncharacterized protein n=1 Tax=Clitoria ternatea TaxID=43366 RepID=A0AAN9KHH1_CLITE